MRPSVLLKSLNRRPWVNTLLYLSVTVISAMLGLGSAVLLTHLLEPNEYGRIGVFLSLLYLAAPIISLAAEGLIAVNKTALDLVEYDRFRRTAIAIAFLIFSCLQFVAVLMWFLGKLSDSLLLLIPAFALLRFTSTMASTEYVAEQRAAVYGCLTLLSSALALALTYVLVSQIEASAAGRILALMCAETVMLLFRYWGRMEQIFKPCLDAIYYKQILRFGLPSMLALFGAWGLNESDKTIVANVFGLTTAGLYTAAASLATIMASFNQSLTNAFFPHMFAELRKGDQVLAVAKRWFLRFLGGNSIFALATVLAYYLFKDLLLPMKYANAASYFYALVAASLGVAVYRPFGLIAEYLQMANARAIAVITGGGVTISIAFFGAQWLDTPLIVALGIGFGYLVTASILAAVLFLTQRNSCNGS